MTDKPEYKFKCQIVDETTGDVVESDFTYLPIIDKWVGTEAAEQAAAKLLDVFVRLGRAEYEREQYWFHCEVCGDKFERVHNVNVDSIATKACDSCRDNSLREYAEANSQFGVGA